MAKSTAPTASKTGRQPGRPSNTDSDETRRTILEVARECFATTGYAATSNRDIAARTGLTAAAVYHHFGRKSDLMIAVYEATERETYERMKAAVDAADGLLAEIEAVLDVTHRSLTKHRSATAFMLVARDEARRHEELKDLASDRIFTDLFADIVKRAVAHGEIDAAEAKHLRGVLGVLSAGLASLGSGVGAAAHRTATEGCKLLLRGTLLPK